MRIFIIMNTTDSTDCLMLLPVNEELLFLVVFVIVASARSYFFMTLKASHFHSIFNYTKLKPNEVVRKFEYPLNYDICRRMCAEKCARMWKTHIANI